jgi:hypothetical protein
MSYGYEYAGYAPQYQSRRSGPPSVHIVAIIQYLSGLAVIAIGGLFALVATGGSTRFTGQIDGYYNGSFAGNAATSFYIVAGVLGLIGLIAIWLGRKLQVGRNWARIVLVILNALSVAGTVYDMVHGVRGGIVIGLVVPALCLILLNTRAARSWCRYRTY